MTAASPPTGP